MNTGERLRIISSVHDHAHLGRDKTLVQINIKYYWPDTYKEICAYVSDWPVGVHICICTYN